MDNSNKKTIRKSQFSKQIVYEDDYKLNKILSKYTDTLIKVMKLKDEMNNVDVERSNKLAENLFNKYNEYTKLKNMYLELVKLQKSEKRNIKLNMLIEYLEEFLYNSQTGDVINMSYTVNTQYGNLINKILQEKTRSSNCKGKTAKKRKKRKRGK